MINNFDSMFEDETHIKHFEIRDGFYGSDIIKQINIKYKREIEQELIQFIKKSLKKNHYLINQIGNHFVLV